MLAQGELDLQIGDLIDDAQKLVGDRRCYVGAFFDGGIGSGQTGRSLFNNWCISTICFGDELRERTPFYSGFDAMAKLSQALTQVNTLEDAIKHSLELVYQTGYPGAMLSLLLENEDETWLIPKQAKGSRYEKILQDGDQAKRELTENDLFVRITRGETSSLILDTQAYWETEFAAGNKLRIHSQYVKPIKTFSEDSLAFLQVDLGDIRYRDRLHETERRVIDSLGVVVEATLMRQINGDQANIARALDEALMECLPIPSLGEALRHFVGKAVEIFKADMGNIRLARYEDRKLVLVAGTGEFYQAQRQAREFLSMDDDSPTCRSFKEDRSLVVNDARNSPAFHQLTIDFRRYPEIVRALNEIGSYANVVFKNVRGESLGTINLLSNQPWFFTRALVHSLNAMAQRVSFLVEHHRRQNHQRFLSQVSTVYEPMTEFDDPLATLRDATRRCREAVNAEIACLYLWDKELKKFVLYAQDGWDERWVKAAAYSLKDPWTGQVALQEGPMYIPDVYRFKVERRTDSLLRYFREMFGEFLSETFTVESLVLPLRSKGGDLGALTLYRKLRSEKAGLGETFTVTDRSALTEAANNLSVMVGGQLHLEELIWEREYHSRRDQALKTLYNAERTESLEQILCQEMMNAFGASQLFLYMEGEIKGQDILHRKLSFNRFPGNVVKSEEIGAEKDAQEKKADILVRLAAISQEIRTENFFLSDNDNLDPESGRREGLMKRLCLPLIGEKKLVGVLDIRWGADRLPARSMSRRAWLVTLGQEIGEAFLRQKRWIKRRDFKKQLERNRLAAQTMGVMLFQSTHRVMNLVQELRAMPHLIAIAESAEERESRLKQLAELINSATDRIKQPMEAARRTRNIEPALHNLRQLVQKCVVEAPSLSPTEVKLNIDENISVWVDHHLTEEAFINIIQNALKAMPDGGELEIKAFLIERQKIAKIIFSDTGSGMSREEIKAAKMGFSSKRNSTGVGVLASQLLIAANNGKLKIENKSKPEHGIQVIVTLPIEPEGEIL